MTVEAPDFDPDLEGHSAVVLDGTCHATTTEYPEGEPEPRTVCGDDPNGADVGGRGEFAEAGVAMCPECWPEEVLNE